ncbi:MAG: hypothetical protein RRX93_04490 [Bacteroidales bacterium]
MKSFFKNLFQNKEQFVFYLLLAFCLLFSIKGSFDAGMSGDEETHNIQAERVFNYYTSFGKDTTAIDLNEKNNLPSYGQFVDNLAYTLAKVAHIEDVMQVRHTTNALFGWIAVLFAGLLAFRLSGKRYLPAIFASLLLFFSPRFLGHSFNNLKDFNLAVAILVGIYYIVVFLQDFPKVKRSTVILLIISIGIAIAVRIGGLILIAYMGLFFLLYFIKEYKLKGLYTPPASKIFGKLFLWGLLCGGAGYVLGILLWPYALVSPIQHPLEVFGYMSQFSISIRQLFEGSLQWSNQLPWYYTSKFIVITIPIAVLIGSCIYLFTGWKKDRRFFTFLLLFCTLFPIFWITYTKANVYGGWRHSMFAYPPLVVFAALGFDSLVVLARKPIFKYIFMALPLALLIGPVSHVIRNHPYEYVYFNELVGGTKNAFGTYELDYYYHSTKEGTEWILEHADTKNLKKGEKIKVATWHTPSVSYYLRKDTAHFTTVFSRIYEMGNNDWDYAVFTVTGMNPDWITNAKMFPPNNTVYTVKVDGVPICIVLKRTDKSDYLGYQAMQRNALDTALPLFRHALEVNPYNEQALENLSNIYLAKANLDSARILASFWAENVPSNISALNLLANVYFSGKDYNNALLQANKMKKISPDDINGYWLAAYSYIQTQNLQFALNELQKLIEIRPDFKAAYQLMAQIYQVAGDNQAAQKCMQIASQLP